MGSLAGLVRVLRVVAANCGGSKQDKLTTSMAVEPMVQFDISGEDEKRNIDVGHHTILPWN